LHTRLEADFVLVLCLNERNFAGQNDGTISKPTRQNPEAGTKRDFARVTIQMEAIDM
jgi:hypothetical protein